MTISSDMPLSLPGHPHAGLGLIECVSGSPSSFAAAIDGAEFRSRPGSWYQYASLGDGSTYVRWTDVGEFLVDREGTRVVCRRERGASNESFEVYLLGQALSFALVKQQLEPLHATAVVVDDRAVAFLGSSAFGKSSLAASFLTAGYRLITDDLLVVQPTQDGFLVYPGPARIKLFAKVARRLFGGSAAAGEPMNGETDKLILPLDEARHCGNPAPLAAIYVLGAPRETCRTREVSIEPLSPREAFVALLRGTFNRRLSDSRRLASQFALTTSVAARVPVKRLTYPRTLEQLGAVRRAVLADFQTGEQS